MTAVVRCRRVWCALFERDVTVEFLERGVPGCRRSVAVRSCTAFDPPAAVACGRRCFDAGFRNQWPPALPVRKPFRPDPATW